MDHPDFQSEDRFVRRFLFRGAEVRRLGDGIAASIAMGPHTEGWVGIPHGGIGMGAVTEMAFMLAEARQEETPVYPFTADFRLGGTSARIGDTVHLNVSPSDRGWEGSIRVNHETAPYLKAQIRQGAGVSPDEAVLPFRTNPFEGKVVPLPYYKNCFVCGSERRHPGLKRKFFCCDSDTAGRTILSRIGFDPDDRDSFCAFQHEGKLHPLPFMALLDETIGWGGFMLARIGAVTVRIAFTFFREISVGEKIVIYGSGERMRGRAEGRLLFWASGGAAVVKENGFLEPVAVASGQWLALKELTEQMKIHLKPEETARQAFNIAKTGNGPVPKD